MNSLTTVKIKDVKSNPFQARRESDPARIRELADEIKETGFWPGGLRARPVNGHYELVFGHRRLEALKLLGHKEIDLEVVALNDTQMATQALVENLQREGLTDIEKADGIAQLAGMFSLRDGIENCTRLLGFSRDAIGQFLRIAKLEPKTKNAAAKARLSRSAIDRAQAIGSDAMVKTAAEQKLSSSALEGIASALHSATNTKVRSKITQQVVAGKITTPEKAKAAVRREAAKAAPKNPLQPDLHNVLLEWTRFIRQWRQELQAVESFREYIDTDPDVATMFRKEVSALIRDLRKLE